MKRVRLKLYSYHTFLVIPFIVLFLYGHNLRQASIDMTWRTLLLGLAGSAALFGLFYLLFRNRLKTGVFVTLLLFGMFQYGVLYEFLEKLYYAGNWPFSNIHRYLVIFYMLVLTGLFLFLKYSRRDFIRINYFLNILLLLLIVFNIVRISTIGTRKLTEKAAATRRSSGIVLKDSLGKPNIYYIILDGYASRNVLKKYYGFDNSEFVSGLQDLGFRFADSAFANHYYTSRSLASTLNMQLLIEPGKVNNHISDNQVMLALKEHGYSTYFLSSGYAVTSNFRADSCVQIDGPDEFEKSLLRHTILRLDDLVGFFARQRLISQFEKMYVLPALSRKPKFCFMHFVAPHPPYVFDRDGNLRTRHRFAEHSWEPKENYVDQLIYVNRMISQLVRKIRTGDPSAIVILQADHGPWVSAASAASVFEARAGILYGWYSPQKIDIPSRTSPVNTFRYIFNAQFGARIQPVADSMVGKAALLRDPIFTKKVRP